MRKSLYPNVPTSRNNADLSPAFILASGPRHEAGLARRIGGRRGPVTFPVSLRNNLAEFFAGRRQPVLQDGARYDTHYRPEEIMASCLR